MIQVGSLLGNMKISSCFLQYFKEKWGVPAVDRSYLLIHVVLPLIATEMNESLIKPFSANEMWGVVKSMPSSNARA